MTTKLENPFNPFSLDMSKINKMMSEMKVPGLDVEALMAAQRKNIEALSAANQLAVEGMQAVAKRQAEILAEAMAQMSETAKTLSTASANPQEVNAKQAEMMKALFEKTMGYMRELAEMISKSNTEAFEVINKRFNESLEELKSMMPKQP